MGKKRCIGINDGTCNSSFKVLSSCAIETVPLLFFDHKLKLTDSWPYKFKINIAFFQFV